MRKPAVKKKTAAKKKTVKKTTGAKKATTWTVSHNPTVKKRKWSPDGDVALCSARAVAEAIRIASGPILSDAEVLRLYWSVATDADTGASILATLEACRKVFGQSRHAARAPESLSKCAALNEFAARLDAELSVVYDPIILGLDLPWGEPHAVTVDPDGTWWSWGQPMSPDDFPGAVIEEAWAVTWCA